MEEEEKNQDKLNKYLIQISIDTTLINIIKTHDLCWCIKNSYIDIYTINKVLLNLFFVLVLRISVNCKC